MLSPSNFAVDDVPKRVIESTLDGGAELLSGYRHTCEEEISTRIPMTRLGFSGLKPLRRRRDISPQKILYNTTVRHVLPHGCEPCFLRVQDVSHLAVYAVQSVFVKSNVKVHTRVYGSPWFSLERTIQQKPFSVNWLCIRNIYSALAASHIICTPCTGIEKERTGQVRMWDRGVKKLSKCLLSVASSQLPEWGSRNQEERRVVYLLGATQNRNQLREFIRFGFTR